MHGATLLDAQQRVLRPAIFGTTGAVRKSALCWKREFRNPGDYRQPDDARIYCA